MIRLDPNSTSLIRDEAKFSSPAAFARHWNENIDRELARRKRSRLLTRESWKKYRNEGADDDKGQSFNLHFAQVETQRPIIFTNKPTVVVQQRPGAGNDHVRRTVAEILQRLLTHCLDSPLYDYDYEMGRVRDDWILGGFGAAEVIYEESGKMVRNDPIPVTKSVDGLHYYIPDDTEIPEEEVIETTAGTHTIEERVVLKEEGTGKLYYQPPDTMLNPWPHIRFQRINPDDFLWEDAPSWTDMGWIAHRTWPNRQQAEARWGKEITDQLKFSIGKREEAMEKDENADDDRDSMDSLNTGEGQGDSRACVWRIWDKHNGIVIFFDYDAENQKDSDEPQNRFGPDGKELEHSEPVGNPAQVIQIMRPDCDLHQFFPVARPVMNLTGENSLICKPEYVQLKGQYEEAENLTKKIRALSDSARAIAIVNAELSEVVSKLSEAEKDVAIYHRKESGDANRPSGDSFDVSWMPLEPIVALLTLLPTIREMVKREIYELTGIPDAQRGDASPYQSGAALEKTEQFSSRRSVLKRNEFARLLRDGLRIATEMIAEKYSWEDIKKMVHVDTMPAAQRDAELQELFDELTRLDSAEPANNPEIRAEEMESITDRIAVLEATVTDEEAEAALRDDVIREFLVEVETGTTVAQEQEMQKRQITELYTLLGQLLPTIDQMVASGIISDTAGKKLTNLFLKGIPGSNEVAAEIMKSPTKKPPDPEAAAKAAEREKQAGAIEVQDRRLEWMDQDAAKKRAHDLKLARINNEAKKTIERLKLRFKKEGAKKGDSK